MFFEILTDAVKDSVEILPFLFIAFCILEIFSHRSEQLKPGLFLRFRYAGPILGALLGCIPQCGIPVLAINLYSGNLITPGTLVAVLVSTSDEALLVLLKAPAGQKIILPLLLIKIIAASAAGYAADLWFEKYFLLPAHISCHHGHDFCEKHGIFLSALKHTLEPFYVFTDIYVCFKSSAPYVWLKNSYSSSLRRFHIAAVFYRTYRIYSKLCRCRSLKRALS